MGVERYSLLSLLARSLPEEALVVSTYIGAVSFEWGALTNEHPRTGQLGQMGNVIGLATGLALALSNRQIVCLDTDGSVLMELGQLVLLGQESPHNLIVVVVDNGVYESIGKGEKGPRPTATAGVTDLAGIALASGIPYAVTVDTLEDLDAELTAAFGEQGCRFINVHTEPGHSRVPPRQADGMEDKYRFVRYIEETEDIQILHLAQQDRRLMKDPAN